MTELATKTNSYAESYEKARLAHGGEPEWLSAIREKSWAAFLEQGFPTMKHEDWRFTNIEKIVNGEYAPDFDNAPVSEEQIAGHLTGEIDDHRFVFVDGVYRPELSKPGTFGNGVVAMPFHEALGKEADLVKKYFGHETRPERHAFTALNDALFTNGYFLHVSANVVVKKPIHLLYLSTGGERPKMSTSRNLFVFDPCSEATLVETHASAEGDPDYFKNVLTEIVARPNSRLDRYVIQRESLNAAHVSTLHVWQDRDSVVRSHAIDFGGELVRHNLIARLDGEGAEAILNGLYMLRGKQHVDNYMWAEHMKENIPSHELYKGILDDESSAVFSGRIYVHPEAQKTDAKQTNQNLLLTDSARVNTKPQLEIYADDVKCTHGATIGQLDKQAQFYLESRGIDRITARNLLVHAFASDIVERISIESLRDKIESLLVTRLGEEAG